ncbi:MAG TPA: ferritin-like protein [Myxococcaceae bacterium]|jgi:rubrerythrin
MLFLHQVPPLASLEDLRYSLQKAIELEHATIPTYLTALYSIKDGTNLEIARLLKSIVVEEMLHMSLACNVLNAIGGHPVINQPSFIPTYPGPLPMGIGSEPGKPFDVPLKKLSKELIREVFMVIEEPEDPLHFKVKAVDFATEAQQFKTIGQFYEDIKNKIEELGQGIFTGDPSLQVTGWFSSTELFPVTDVASAKRAIDIIITQGEGTRISPMDAEDMPAHYYRYEEIYRGRYLVKDPSEPEGYSFSGKPIKFDKDGVLPMADNPGTQDFPQGSLALRLANQFDYTYTSLLNSLHQTFNGEPKRLDAALGLMFSLKLLAQQLMATPLPGTKANAGPRFLYSPLPKGSVAPGTSSSAQTAAFTAVSPSAPARKNVVAKKASPVKKAAAVKKAPAKSASAKKAAAVKKVPAKKAPVKKAAAKKAPAKKAVAQRQARPRR